MDESFGAVLKVALAGGPAGDKRQVIHVIVVNRPPRMIRYFWASAGVQPATHVRSKQMKIHIPLSKGQHFLQMMQYVVFGSVILYAGKTLLVPLSFALLISFILFPVCTWLERHGVKRMTAIVTGISLVMLLGLAAAALLVNQLYSFLHEWPAIRQQVLHSWQQLSAYMENSMLITQEQQQAWLRQASDGGNVAGWIQNMIALSLTNLAVLSLIPILAALILYYRHRLLEGLFLLLPGQNRFRIRYILTLAIQAYYDFIKGMLLVYLIVGILNSVGLLLLGVPHAIFFGMVASILTFIPYVGIIVGSLLPIAMAWVTYNSIWYPVGVVLIFSFVQYLEANVIFPLTVSNRLNINALATLIAIIAGGMLWGVAGMILFVPFLAILKLIADRHPELKTLAVFIGTDSSNHPAVRSKE